MCRIIACIIIYIIYSYVLHIAHFQFGTVSNHLNLALCRIWDDLSAGL